MTLAEVLRQISRVWSSTLGTLLGPSSAPLPNANDKGGDQSPLRQLGKVNESGEVSIIKVHVRNSRVRGMRSIIREGRFHGTNVTLLHIR